MRQQKILEMKKLTEYMCLNDHQALPEFSHIPGLILPSGTFSNCLTIVEFLRSFGKVLGFSQVKGVPSLGVLLKELLCQGAVCWCAAVSRGAGTAVYLM